MARGKNNRRRASIDGPSPTMNNPHHPHHPHHHHCSSSSPNNNGLITNNNNNNNNFDCHPVIPTTRQEILDAIEFHWKNLSLELKAFLFKCPQELSLRKFVDYWNNPVRVENTTMNIAASICGCSWYLALNYMSIGQVVEARALVLNGCFLQQCYNKPFEEIVTIARSISGDDFRNQLPFFTDGLLAISSEERLSNFLRTKVSSDYQRRMSFATQTPQTKKKVQDYVNQISSDWNNGSSANMTANKKNEARRRRASLDTLPAESFIEIKLVDAHSKEETKMRYGVAMTLKSLFKKYAEDRNLSLRQLRFSYEGRTLFLSSVGHKTPQDLGMNHLDSITVINNAVVAASSSSSSEESSSSSSDESKENARRQNKASRNKVKGRRRSCRRASWAGPEIIGEEERLKLIHSRQLSRAFTEMAPQFEQIRQKLNALNLTCAPPKVKKTHRKSKLPVATMPIVSVDNPHCDNGGKAGVPFYAVHVGATENLYNTAKKGSPSSLKLQGGQKSISIDLHGMTKEEALTELDTKLPQWNDIAMRGAYPWVIPVVIICGGGNQILSEAVDRWIKCNENVAKAPKKKFSRRCTM